MKQLVSNCFIVLLLRGKSHGVDSNAMCECQMLNVECGLKTI